MRHPLLAALAASLAGIQKTAAGDVWPGLSESSQKSRLSRVLDGSLAIPPELIDRALAGPHGSVLLDYFESRATGDPNVIRRELLSKVTDLRGQLEFFFEEMHRADEAEKRMAKVDSSRLVDRARQRVDGRKQA